MKMTLAAYQRCKDIIAYYAQNPGKNILTCAEALNIKRENAQSLIKQLTDLDLLKFSTSRTRGGKTHYYTATGKPLPERCERYTRNIEPESIKTLPAVDQQQFAQLPGMLRAITPVMQAQHPAGTIITGYTVDQHKKQSQQLRKEWNTAHRGAVYSGESRL